MTPLKLTIENFRGIGFAELYFNNEGLKRIHGKTGIGKSTFVDALVWVHYGMTKGKRKGNDVVNRTAKKDCKVTVEYQDFKIERYRKHSVHKDKVFVYNKIDGEWDSKEYTVEGDVKSTNENIEQILRMSMDVYIKVISFGQNDEKTGKWGELKDKALKQAMTEALMMGQIDINKQAVIDYKKEVEKHLQIVISSPLPLQSKLEVLSYKKATTERNIDNARQELERRRSSNSNRILSLSHEIEQTSAEIERLSGLKVMSEEEFNSKTSEFDEYKDKLEKVKSLRFTIQTQYIDKSSEVDVASKSILSLDREIESITRSLNNIESLVGTQCRECGKTYEHQDSETTVKTYENNISIKESEKQALVLHKNTLVELKNSKASDLDKIDKAEKDLEKLLNAYHVLVREYNEGKSIVQQIKSLEDKKQRLEADKTYTEQQEIGQYDDTKDIKLIDSVIKEMSEVQAELDGVLDNISELELLISTLNDLSDSIEAQKGYIIDNITVPLNENIQKLVNEIYPDMSIEFKTIDKLKSGELREKFCINASIEGSAKEYDDLSGGQRDICNLCISLGFAITVRDRQSSIPDFLFIDEGFSGLDIDLATNGVKLLQSLEIGNLYLMSHETHIQDIIPNVIELERNNNLTTIKESS